MKRMGFIVETGDVYYVDPVNHLISGGIFEVPTIYADVKAMLGDQAVVTFMDGRFMGLGLVMSYL